MLSTQLHTGPSLVKNVLWSTCNNAETLWPLIKNIHRTLSSLLVLSTSSYNNSRQRGERGFHLCEGWSPGWSGAVLHIECFHWYFWWLAFPLLVQTGWAALEMDYLQSGPKVGCGDVFPSAANLRRPPFYPAETSVLWDSTNVCARDQRERHFLKPQCVQLSILLELLTESLWFEV